MMFLNYVKDLNSPLKNKMLQLMIQGKFQIADKSRQIRFKKILKL